MARAARHHLPVRTAAWLPAARWLAPSWPISGWPVSGWSVSGWRGPGRPANAWHDWMQLGGAAAATWLAASQVIALRMPVIATAMLSPEARNDPELRRMVSEKPAVFARSWQILAWRFATAPLQAQAAALVPLRRAAEANARRLSRGR